MKPQEITRAVVSSERGGWILPFYNSFALSNIPGTIFEFFNIPSKNSFFKNLPEKFKTLRNQKNLMIIVLLADGFGYRQWLANAKHLALFQAIARKGAFFPITTVFPSTTAAAISSLNTGRTPNETGVFEWFLYEPRLNKIIMPLLFSPLGSEKRDVLTRQNVSPHILTSQEIEKSVIHKTLRTHKVRSLAINKDAFVRGGYNEIFLRGATKKGYTNARDLSHILRRTIVKSRAGPRFIYVYWADIDKAGHAHGPSSPEYKREVRALHTLLCNALSGIHKKVAQKTILIITADHGQVDVKPKKTLYLNSFQWLEKAFMRKNGRPIYPTGGPRDVFLAIQPGRLKEIFSRLRRVLKNDATVLSIREAHRRKLFGNNAASELFKKRAGNILILPKRKNTIWYMHPEGKPMMKKGHHGGLSPDEMLIPFAMAKLSDIV